MHHDGFSDWAILALGCAVPPSRLRCGLHYGEIAPVHPTTSTFLARTLTISLPLLPSPPSTCSSSSFLPPLHPLHHAELLHPPAQELLRCHRLERGQPVFEHHAAVYRYVHPMPCVYRLDIPIPSLPRDTANRSSALDSRLCLVTVMTVTTNTRHPLIPHLTRLALCHPP
jgi:hypothetical protein